jgi:hypothetical protein
MKTRPGDPEIEFRRDDLGLRRPQCLGGINDADERELT